ncbi:efflux RND transporter periplasmic adaptor subunit [Caulobacter sp. RHG1]|uniref:efflux RND transporter periplasmic adaptor subunit n=1 Tax=Caulobacter sp. (strain RHG1) TaxID=2545762 RepID=UPI0019D625E5|nr:hypothetical protein [Caulobacter sp. RHG1]NQE63735.1 hypothetical protein [Caulobacter sp. RHG1]
MAPPSTPARLLAPETLALLGACLALTACGPGKPAASHVKPAKVEAIGHETELMRLTLTQQAENRLGLKYATVESGSARQSRALHGEVMASPAAGGLPVTTSQDLGALAASQARADGEVGRLTAEAEVARRAFERAQALVREGAGSLRAQDEAESVLGAARANLAAARQQRALLGPRLTGQAQSAHIWIKVPVFVGDLASLDRDGAAQVRPLGGDSQAMLARPVAGPPSASPTAGAVDLYYALANPGGRLRLGERVSVSLPVGGQDTGLIIPASALLRDIHGGEWVYVRTKPQTFERRRVETASQQGDRVVLARGLSAGQLVVSAGAAELFGTEFGAK